MGTVATVRLGTTLLVTIQEDIHDEAAREFQRRVLEAIEREGSRGLIIEISAMDVLDSYVARVLINTAKMGRLMGARAVIAGMRPEVAATLVQMGYFLDDIEAALSVEDALELLSVP